MSINAIPFFQPTTCLGPGENLMKALELMLENKTNHLPICDTDGTFIGVISTNAILRALIPASARVEGGLSNLKFVGDGVRMLTTHLHGLENLKVGEFAKKDMPVLQEDSPILEAVLLLSQTHAPLPVVGKDGKMRGVLSRRALLAYLAQQAGL
ncbi:MAG TPA: CBS domain-containing protein [Sulfuricella sp.]|nr:CBS domain-containing protein [Sulfuricella sp.]